MTYGQELIIDIHECDLTNLSSRSDIEDFCNEICDVLDMNKGPLHFWDYEGFPQEYKDAPPHLKGITAIQFLTTSNLTIHILDELKSVYLNIFSCKSFDSKKVIEYVQEWTLGNIVQKLLIERE
jgi:S-adenosylmethionine/arginine decarboxylase-like enzyme